MKVAVISDTHDNLVNLAKFFSATKDFKVILHCGDVCAAETAKEMATNFDGKIFLSLGNADLKTPLIKFGKNYKKLEIFGEFGETKLDGLKIAISHFLEQAKDLCQSGKYDFVFFGHTHKPWLTNVGKSVLANPGNLAGLYYKASFAVLDTKTKNLSLKILEEIK